MRIVNGKYKFPPGNNLWRSLLASFTFLRDPILAISRNMIRYSGTYSAILFGRGKIILTEDPDFIQYVLRENHSNYQKSELSYKTAARLFGNGLLFSNGEPWLRQRRLIQPAFHHGKIQGLYEIVIKTAKEMISGIQEGDEVDVYPLMRRLSFGVLIQSLFDIRLTPETILDLSEGFTDLQDFLLKDVNQPFRKLLYPVNGAERIILEKSRLIRSIVKGIIDKRHEEKEIHNDLLDMLLNVKYEDTGETMGEEQIIDEILVLLFAGHETTANTLSWLLYLISTNPEEARKLKVSIAQMKIQESPKNEYMNAVISESMRLYPAAWMTDRVALSDDRFGSFSYPKGTIIIPFFYGLHRNKLHWEKESAFDPGTIYLFRYRKNKKSKKLFPFWGRSPYVYWK